LKYHQYLVSRESGYSCTSTLDRGWLAAGTGRGSLPWVDTTVRVRQTGRVDLVMTCSTRHIRYPTPREGGARHSAAIFHREIPNVRADRRRKNRPRRRPLMLVCIGDDSVTDAHFTPRNQCLRLTLGQSVPSYSRRRV